MKLDDILKLEKKSENIDEILKYNKSVENNFSPYEFTYSKAFLASIYFELKQYEHSFKIYMEIYDNIKQYEDIFKNYIDQIIYIAIKLEMYENALLFYKDKNLLISNYYDAKYIIDISNIYLLKNSYKEALDMILQYNFLETLDKLESNLILIKAYYYLNNIDSMFLSLNNLKDLSINYNNEFYYDYYLLYLAKYFFKINKYEDAILNYKELLTLKESLKKDFLMEVIVDLLEIYSYIGDYHRASILESEYEEIFDSGIFKLRKKFYELCVKLYKKYNNKFSCDAYEQKLDILIKSNKKKTNKEKDINIINKKNADENLDLIKNNLNYDTFKEEIFNYNLNIDIKLDFLNYFILINNFLEKEIYFNEVIFVDFNNYLTYQYKKNRCYDRKKTEIDFSNTIFSICNLELIINNINNYQEYMDLISNKYYKDLFYKHIVCFKNEKYGILFQTLDDLFINDDIKNKLKLFFDLVSKRYNLNNLIQEYKSDLESFKIIFDKINIPLKFIIEDNCDSYILNDSFNKLLFSYNHNNLVTQNEFLNLLKIDYYNQYKEYLNYIKNNDILYSNFLYQFKDNDTYYKEYMQKVKFNNKYIYFFYLLVDKDQNKQNIKQDNTIEYDYLTKSYNRKTFYEDIKNSIKDNKFSLLLIDIFDFKNINLKYGINISDNILKEISSFLMEKYKTYRLKSDEFILLLNLENDKRNLNNEGTFLIKSLEELIKNKFNIDLTFIISSLRYPNQTKDNKVEKLLMYLDYTYKKAKKIKENGVSIYQEFLLDDYKKEVQEEQILLNIKENLVNNKFSISYKQIVNLKDMLVIGFIPYININGLKINEELIRKICFNSKYIVEYDYYLIKKVINSIINIKKETNTYIRVYIFIDHLSFEKPNFVDYLGNLILENNILKDSLNLLFKDLKYDNKTKEKITKIKNLGVNVYTNNINNLFSCDYSGLFLEDFSSRENLIKQNVLLFEKMLEEMNLDLIVGNLDSENNYNLYKELGIKKTYGNYIKKSFTELDIVTKILKK